MFNFILDKFFDAFGNKVEDKIYIGHGDYKSKRSWELKITGRIYKRDFDLDYQ